MITALSIEFLAQPFPQQGEYVKFIAYWIMFVKNHGPTQIYVHVPFGAAEAKKSRKYEIRKYQGNP
jgi:hypothetical protein